jgi:hypothetical protein
MNIFKNITALMIIMMIAVSCETDEDLKYSLDYLSAPSNISVNFDITQDNSGLVTIIPNADGVVNYLIAFGDTIDETPTAYKVGDEITHVYEEGTYTVGITAVGINGQNATHTEELIVSFIAPENLVITIENDIAVSKQVNISANADYAIEIEYYFGELTEDVPVTADPDETVSHVYANPGDYEITVIAKSGAIKTLDSTFTFTVTEIIGPATAAPAPPNRLESDVISVFSDAFTNLTGTDFNPNWGQSTIVTTETIGGSSTLKYANLNYQGTQFASAIDASAMEFLHVDVWTDDATTVNFYCISTGPAEKAYSFAITAGEWVSYEIPLTHFDNVNLADIIQFKVDGTAGSSVYFDNIYFYRETPTSPTTAAPTPPARDADKVISVFSDAYTSLTATDFNPNWGQSTVVTFDEIAASDTIMKYANLNYQGTQFASAIDASSFGYLHVDMWTYDATSVNISCISTGPAEKAYALPITSGEWVSYDIPLTKFSSVVDLADIIQFKFDGTAGATIFLDNIYFY